MASPGKWENERKIDSITVWWEKLNGGGYRPVLRLRLPGGVRLDIFATQWGSVYHENQDNTTQ